MNTYDLSGDTVIDLRPHAREIGDLVAESVKSCDDDGDDYHSVKTSTDSIYSFSSSTVRTVFDYISPILPSPSIVKPKRTGPAPKF